MDTLQYKVQYYDDTSIAWKDVQRRYDSVTEAAEALKKHKHSRIVEVDDSARVRRVVAGWKDGTYCDHSSVREYALTNSQGKQTVVACTLCKEVVVLRKG